MNGFLIEMVLTPPEQEGRKHKLICDHAHEIAALLVKSRILPPSEESRATSLLAVSLEERFGKEAKQEICSQVAIV